jgi:hypothetical protein
LHDAVFQSLDVRQAAPLGELGLGEPNVVSKAGYTLAKIAG